MDHLRRLLFKIPCALFDVPDGVYGDVDGFLDWLEGPAASEMICNWEERQRTVLKGIIRNLENQRV